MNYILIELNENQEEIANQIRSLNCKIEDMTISHFNADPTVVSFLIAVTPVVVTQISEIIKTIVSNPSKGKVKIGGVEIEGFSYDETLELLKLVAQKNSNKTEKNS